MKKFTALLVIGAVALVGNWFTPQSADAIPAFARQTGVPCLGCHFQHIPKLGPFGREFKLGGYTQTSVELIEEDNLSLMPFPGIGGLMKMYYVKTSTPASLLPDKNTAWNDSGTDRGQWELADEDVLWLGGRIAENFGMVSEFAGGSNILKFVYSADFGGIQGGVILYRNDGAGPGHSMELWNTGGVKNHRQFEKRHGSYASEVLDGVGIGSAMGLHLFGATDTVFVNVGMWSPNGDPGTVADAGFDLATYYRIAFTPQIWEGIDFMIGVQGSAGEVKTCVVQEGHEWDGDGVAEADESGGCEFLTTQSMSSMRIDSQVQMDIGGMSFEFTAEYLTNPSESNSDDNKSGYFNNGTKDEKGLVITGALGVTTNLQLKVASASYTDVWSKGAGNTDAGTHADMTVLELGLNYNLAQNIIFLLEYESFDGDARSHDTLMLTGIEFAL